MIVFLVEDYSTKKFLEGILPRLGFEEHQLRRLRENNIPVDKLFF